MSTIPQQFCHDSAPPPPRWRRPNSAGDKKQYPRTSMTSAVPTWCRWFLLWWLFLRVQLHFDGLAVAPDQPVLVTNTAVTMIMGSRQFVSRLELLLPAVARGAAGFAVNSFMNEKRSSDGRYMCLSTITCKCDTLRKLSSHGGWPHPSYHSVV